MKLCLKNEDSIHIENDCIHVLLDNKKYIYSKSEIEAAMIITNNLGSFYDDMCLVIRIDSETAIFIMSEHPLYKKFLFDELTSIIEVDYNVIIEAAVCCDNKIFIIYKKADI